MNKSIKQLEREEDKIIANSLANKKKGRRNNQKLKPFLVLLYLSENTDETHCANAKAIKSYLEKFGIESERRSIYRDIAELNRVLLSIAYNETLEGADIIYNELIEDEPESIPIIYDYDQKGYYIRSGYSIKVGDSLKI